MTPDLHGMLERKWEKGTRPKDIYANHIAAKPAAFVNVVVEGLHSSKKRVRNGCAELASLFSADYPLLFYPHAELFLENLAARDPVLRWEAACTLGHLATVDLGRRLCSALPLLKDGLRADSIVLQGHAVKALARMALAYSDEAPRVLQWLVEVEELFPKNRVGYLIDSMTAFVHHPELRSKALRFVQTHQDSSIQSVARKARRAIQQLSS